MITTMESAFLVITKVNYSCKIAKGKMNVNKLILNEKRKMDLQLIFYFLCGMRFVLRYG
jgi:hypothetical protein